MRDIESFAKVLYEKIHPGSKWSEAPADVRLHWREKAKRYLQDGERG